MPDDAEHKFPCIRFSQYASGKEEDDLILFAAPAKLLASWAGIPRKAWHIRMLFQRPMTTRREAELKQFWDDASKGGQDGFILGPTAIVVAIQGKPSIHDDFIDLSATPLVDVEKAPLQNLPLLVERIYPETVARLSTEQRAIVSEFESNPFGEFPEIEHDYVFEFALQLVQMRADPVKFVEVNDISNEELDEIVESMESICRPAIVVDGQHRLWGAASSERPIFLPVVAIPNCSWTDQVYQFVVINETAQKVETGLLTDIFGSSLTKPEQGLVRRKLSKTRVDVESRIAAVIASRDPASPFHNMVQLQIEGRVPENYKPYLSERAIRTLINGSTQRFSKGWRSDDEFYTAYVAPTFSDRDEWERWTDGQWREYWIVFWRCVRDFYNSQAEKLGRPHLWRYDEQTNLTKSVTLRQVQTLFMVKSIEKMREIEKTASILRESLGVEAADQKILQLQKDRALPTDLEVFRSLVLDDFLERGIPVKVFLTPWKKSLDDFQGQLDLWETLETAFDRAQNGERFDVRGRIFEAGGWSKKED